MAVQFYNRYVPPKSATSDEPKEGHPAKNRKLELKRKRDIQDNGLPASDDTGREGKSKHTRHANQGEPRKKVKKTVKKPRTVSARDDSNGHESINKSKEKHKSVMYRYAKATDASEANVVNIQESPEPVLAQRFPDSDSHGLEPLPQPAPIEEPEKVSFSAALPKWIRECVTVSPQERCSMTDLPLSEAMIETLKHKSLTQALPIQAAVVPLLHDKQGLGRDLCISAATGSGKTLAYALPLVEALKDKFGRCHRLRAIIVVPTRELVSQAYNSLRVLTKNTDLEIGCSLGSQTMQEEKQAFVTRQQRYDSEACEAPKSQEVDEYEKVMDWDFEAMMSLEEPEDILPDNVLEYASKIDILICTPGRLVEHIKQTKGFTLHNVQWLVVDEADRLLDESFQDWVDVVIPELEYLPPLTPLEERFAMRSTLPRRREVQKVILSASMTRDVGLLASLKLRRPKLVELKSEENAGDHEVLELPATLQEYAVPIADSDTKPLALLKVLNTPFPEPPPPPKKQEVIGHSSAPNSSDDQSSDSESSDLSNISSASAASSSSNPNSTSTSTPKTKPRTWGTLIFTRDNENALRLSRLLSLLHPSLKPLIGTLTKLSSSSRTQKTLRAFQNRSVSILIASDRASRGLDIEDLGHVINYDVPATVVNYVHRVGRTARAGREGKATTLVEGYQARWFWNEIARSENLRRSSKLVRWNLIVDVGLEDRERYEEAVRQLGEEARTCGENKKPGRRDERQGR